MKDIYELKLHETIDIMKDNGFPDLKMQITRVPGGWIYNAGAYMNPVFVPYNEEFKAV